MATSWAGFRSSREDIVAVLWARWRLRRATSVGARTRLRGRPVVVVRCELIEPDRQLARLVESTVSGWHDFQSAVAQSVQRP